MSVAWKTSNPRKIICIICIDFFLFIETRRAGPMRGVHFSGGPLAFHKLLPTLSPTSQLVRLAWPLYAEGICSCHKSFASTLGTLVSNTRGSFFRATLICRVCYNIRKESSRFSKAETALFEENQKIYSVQYISLHFFFAVFGNIENFTL